MKYDAFIRCATVLSLGAVDANLSNIASERALMGNRCCVANVLEIPNRDTYARMRNIPVGRCRHCSISDSAHRPSYCSSSCCRHRCSGRLTIVDGYVQNKPRVKPEHEHPRKSQRHGAGRLFYCWDSRIQWIWNEEIIAYTSIKARVK
jgi:hypothetical protein